MKILIAEDEEVMLMTIKEILKKQGFEVLCASDGSEAIRILENHTPDLIITDLLMPYTSGLEVIKVVKSEKQNEIPIIVLSVLREEDTILEAFQLGADDFVSKPFEAAELLIRVKRLLKNKSLPK